MALPIVLLAASVALLAAGCRAAQTPTESFQDSTEDPDVTRLNALRGEYRLNFEDPKKIELYTQLRDCGVENRALDRGLWRTPFNSMSSYQPEGVLEANEDGTLESEEIYLGLWRGPSEAGENCDALEEERQRTYEDQVRRWEWALALTLSPDRRERALRTSDQMLQSLTTYNSNPHIIQKRGDIRAMQGEYREAARFYRRALTDEVDLVNYPILMRLAQVHRLQGREYRAQSYEAQAQRLSEQF